MSHAAMPWFRVPEACTVQYMKTMNTAAPFDRSLARRRRDRAAGTLVEADFLLQAGAERILERLDDVTRRFPLAAEMGARTGILTKALRTRADIDHVVAFESSLVMAARTQALRADEEWLPLRPGSVDLLVCNLSLHTVNDLPGVLIQARNALKPDGLFLAVTLGVGTLKELRDVLAWAESSQDGGLSPRVHPFVEVRDAGALLQRAGFALPVADTETLSVHYGNPLRLLQDLRAMGETNVLHDRRRAPLRRTTLGAALARYASVYGGSDNRVPASFELITLTGWAPAPTQQKPLKPGSAGTRLADALDTDEVPLKD